MNSSGRIQDEKGSSRDHSSLGGDFGTAFNRIKNTRPYWGKQEGRILLNGKYARDKSNDYKANEYQTSFSYYTDNRFYKTNKRFWSLSGRLSGYANGNKQGQPSYQKYKSKDFSGYVSLGIEKGRIESVTELYFQTYYYFSPQVRLSADVRGGLEYIKISIGTRDNWVVTVRSVDFYVFVVLIKYPFKGNSFTDSKMSISPLFTVHSIKKRVIPILEDNPFFLFTSQTISVWSYEILQFLPLLFSTGTNHCLLLMPWSCHRKQATNFSWPTLPFPSGTIHIAPD